MDENNKMDNLFRKAVEQFEHDSLDKVWNKLDKELDKKNAAARRKKFFWYRFLPLLLLIGSVVSYFYFAPTDAPLSVPTIAQSKRLAEDKRNGICVPQNSDNKPILSIEESKRISRGNHDREINEKKIAEALKNVFSSAEPSIPVAQAGNSRTEETGMIEAEQKKNIADESVASSNPEIVAAGKKEEITESTPTQIVSEIPASGNSASPGKEPQAETNPVELPAAPQPEKSNITEKNPEPEPVKRANETPVSNSGEPAVQADSTASKPDSLQSSPEKKKKLKEILSAITSHMGVEAYYSPEIVNRALSSNTTYIRQGAVETQVSRYTHEKSDYSHSFGGRIVYDISKKISVAAGISFSAYNQSATYNYINIISDSAYKQVHQHDEDDDGHGHDEEEEDEEEEHDHDSTWIPGITVTDHFVIYTSAGAIDLKDIPAVPGHNPNNDTLGLTSVVEYKIYFLSIPFTVRYQLASKKFKYFAEIGFSLNYIRSNEAQVIIADSYSETNKLDGLRKMNYSFILGAGMQYALNDHLKIFIGPQFRYSLSPVNEDNPVLSSPYFLGIQSGLGYYF
jgi:opacity protein-like surface antigen